MVQKLRTVMNAATMRAAYSNAWASPGWASQAMISFTDVAPI
jgi:hypothetical protein